MSECAHGDTCDLHRLVPLTVRAFANGLINEARRIANADIAGTAMRPDGLPGPRTLAAIRLVEATLQSAARIELSPGYTHDHLDAVIAVMQTLPIPTGPPDEICYEELDCAVWAPVQLEVMRIGMYGFAPPRKPSASNSPNHQNMPRRTPMFNRPTQSSAADVGTKIHQMVHDELVAEKPLSVEATPGTSWEDAK